MSIFVSVVLWGLSFCLMGCSAKVSGTGGGIALEPGWSLGPSQGIFSEEFPVYYVYKVKLGLDYNSATRVNTVKVINVPGDRFIIKSLLNPGNQGSASAFIASEQPMTQEEIFALSLGGFESQSTQTEMKLSYDGSKSVLKICKGWVTAFESKKSPVGDLQLRVNMAVVDEAAISSEKFKKCLLYGEVSVPPVRFSLTVNNDVITKATNDIEKNKTFLKIWGTASQGYPERLFRHVKSIVPVLDNL